MPKLKKKIVKFGQFTSRVTEIATISLNIKSTIGVRIVKSGPICFSLNPSISTP